MAIHRPRRGVLIAGIGALLVLSLFVLSLNVLNVPIDPAITASEQVAVYANREHLVPELFTLADRSVGANGQQIFDYEYNSRPIHLLRIEVSHDGAVEVSRMNENVVEAGVGY